MKRYVLAPTLAALAMFVFGAIFWMSPFPYQVLGRVADDSAAALELAKIFPTTGHYLIPGAYLDEKIAGELMQRGPIAQVVFVKEGQAAMAPSTLVKGYLHYFVTALLLAFFLGRSSAAIRTYGCVVASVTTIGVIAAVFIDFTDTIWWHHPWSWQFVCALYNVLAFFVGSLVLAIFFKPAPAPAA